MKRAVLILVLFALSIIGAKCQQVVRSMSGTDFWITFLRQSSNYSQCYILVASEDTCTAYIENPLQGWNTTVSVPAGGISQVLVSNQQSGMGYGCSIVDEAWHVSTTAPAIVYAKVYNEYSFDMTAVLPLSALRCDYMTQTYNSELDGPEVFIVAPFDSTEVRIVLNEGISNPLSGGNTFRQLYYPGDTIDTILMRGQNCRLYSAYGSAEGYTSGFSGTTIHSSKPTAVFQGHTTAWIPVSTDSRLRYGAGDILYEQCIPTTFWGKRFFVPSIPGRTVAMHGGPGGVLVGDLVMVTALNDGCMLTLGDTVVGPLASGDTYRFILSDHSVTMPVDVDLDLYQAGALPIEATSPVSVFFYIGSAYFAGSPGDPASAVVPPLEQGVSFSIIQVKNTPQTHNHFLSIVMPTADVPLMTVNGTHVDTFFTSASNGYSFARIPVSEGVYRLDAGSGRFLAMSYGLGNTESYAFAAGMALRDTSYDIRASRHSLCVGDTVFISAHHTDSVLLDWSLDGQHLELTSDTLMLSFDSVGRHVVTIAMTPLEESQCWCSSIRDTVMEILTVNPSYNNYVEDYLCDNSIYHWNGQDLSSAGDYNASLVSMAGCDSVVNLHLTMSPLYPFYTTGLVCPGDTLLWRGRVLTDEGTYNDTIRSTSACDTVASINLVFYPSSFNIFSDTICSGGSLLWHGRVLFDEGIYTDSLTTTNGCDSIVSVQLSVAESPWVSFNIKADCESSHYSVFSTALGDTVGYEYSWHSAPIDVALEGQPWDSLVLSPSQTTVYSLNLAGRCPTDTSFTLQPVRWPVAQMRVQPKRLSIDQPSFDAYDLSENADRREWLVDDIYAGSSAVIHYTAYELADSLLLTLVASNGACQDTLTIAIPVDNPEVWAPNIFTPDGTDNNRFAPMLNECKAEGMYIYNRQGLLMAHIEGDNPSWDGTHNGAPCPQEAYVYVLNYRADVEPQRLQKKVGSVTLLR